MFQPSGNLTVGNAQTVLASGLQAIADGQTRIDLADLATVDSAAVATLLAWKRAAQARNASMVYEHCPENLLSLIHLYDLTALLQPASPAKAPTA